MKKFHKFDKFDDNKRFKPPQLKTIDPDEEQIKKYKRGDDKIQRQKIQTKFFKHKLVRQENNFNYAVKQSARAEILLNEEDGFIIPDEGEETIEYTQSDIKQNVDITSATKSFKLNLEEFGPYHINYTRNGRHLLLGGRKGHIAAFDWISKKLYCEFSVMEEIYDIQWLHLETMFAVAQKKWVHFYDNKGTEVHCVKKMHGVTQMEFLPYHFLLATGSNEGWLKWLDVSIGEMVAEYRSLDDKISIMKQNPSNAVICVGSAKGVVSMWSPSVNKPLARILCHSSPITAMAFNSSGSKIVTTGLDRKIKLWDSRNYSEPLSQYVTKLPVNHVALSQRNVMAISMGDVCEVFRNINLGNLSSINSYLRHIDAAPITAMEFVPYEDILGIGSQKGFSSILVPGAGEANFDSLEQNPFRTKKQRREHEVKALLEKVPADLITLDTSQIVGVDVEHLQEKLEAKPETEIPMHKLNEKRMEKRSGIEKSKVKQSHQQQEKQHLLKAVKIDELREKKALKKKSSNDDDQNVLDRFKKKVKK